MKELEKHEELLDGDRLGVLSGIPFREWLLEAMGEAHEGRKNMTKLPGRITGRPGTPEDHV